MNNEMNTAGQRSDGAEAERLLETLPDYDSDCTIDRMIHKIITCDKQYDLSKIISAYEFAEKAHRGQKRSSGQDYIIHPLAVAEILLDFCMDTDTICAALLHDVVEDTPATFDDLKKRFGQDVAMLVDGVTKLSKIPTITKEQMQAENVRKMVLAMFNDVRVIIIKLADRLHNMRTLKYRPPEKRRYTATETMEIYVPICRRFGIKAVKEELEDLSLRVLDPYAYIELEKIMESRKEEREAFIETIKKRIEKGCSTFEFKEPPVIDGRVKSIYSMYSKIYNLGKSIDQIYDKYAVRVIVSTKQECYNVLGIVHDMFQPLPNRFKDYISTPKPNSYQSLHTTVLGEEGIPFEVQIRTMDMHFTAEYGVAAHWKYKEGGKGGDGMEKRMMWVRQVIEAQQSADDVEEIVNAIKTEAIEEIFVMTPKGMTISLPVGANVIDFAYKIHTEVGHRTIGAKVDGKIVPLDYQLQMGQICEILTAKERDRGPSRDWLNIVKTNEARSKIRSWYKREKREENIAEGKKSLQRAFKRYRINLDESQYTEFLHDDFHRHNCATLDDFYASIGYGGVSLNKIIPRLKDKYDKEYGVSEGQETLHLIKPKSPHVDGIVLDRENNIAIKYAACCNPLPGDEIVGFITRGHGLSVHTTKCRNYLSALQRNDPAELQRWTHDIQWTDEQNIPLQTEFTVTATDRVGLVYDITSVLTASHIPIVHSSSRNLKSGNASFDAAIIISGTEQLEKLFEKLRKVDGVISVERSKK